MTTNTSDADGGDADEPFEPVQLNDTMEIRSVSVDDLLEQDINPNVMDNEMFGQLVENIKKRGKLESLPYVHERDDGTIEIISGHHRTRASREAGLEEIPVIVETGDLSRDAVKAKQLAHNSISGEQDDQLVSRLFSEIQDVDYKLEAYIDPDELDLPPDQYNVDRVTVRPDSHVVNLLFLPTAFDDYNEVVDKLSSGVEQVDIADVEDWERFKTLVNDIKDVNEIRSTTTAVQQMCEIVEMHLEEQSDAEGDSVSGEGDSTDGGEDAHSGDAVASDGGSA